MAQIDITVNDRIYKVTCDDGQEPRLQRLAAYIDGEVAALVRELGQIGDARLILLAALTISDELFEAKKKLAELEQSAEPLDQETVGGAARVFEAAAARIHGMAGRLKSA